MSPFWIGFLTGMSTGPVAIVLGLCFLAQFTKSTASARPRNTRPASPSCSYSTDDQYRSYRPVSSHPDYK